LKVIKYGRERARFPIPPQFKVTSVTSTYDENGIISYTSSV